LVPLPFRRRVGEQKRQPSAKANLTKRIRKRHSWFKGATGFSSPEAKEEGTKMFLVPHNGSGKKADPGNMKNYELSHIAEAEDMQ